MEGNAHYPTLENMVESEGVCPICLLEMNETPKYGCENGHKMCYRCKPYYWSCSTCNLPLNHIPQPEMDSTDEIPPPTHFMRHPMPMPMPSAPEMDFIEMERGGRRWGPPPPGPDQNLVRCQYSEYGCWVKVPEYLSELHETRCQFRPYLEVEHLPTDLPQGDELVSCPYAAVGCDATMPPWRQHIHEPVCSFKERFEALDQEETEEPEPEPEEDEDPDELVECKLKIYGCLVKMPRRRKSTHEEKCNYNKYYKEEDFEEPEEEEEEAEPEEEEEEEVAEPEEEEEAEPEEEQQQEEPEEEDPESQVDCRWAEQGCRIRPKLYRKETHEEKCNYKMEECSFKDNGCEETFLRARRFVHERICDFKN